MCDACMLPTRKLLTQIALVGFKVNNVFHKIKGLYGPKYLGLKRFFALAYQYLLLGRRISIPYQSIPFLFCENGKADFPFYNYCIPLFY